MQLIEKFNKFDPSVFDGKPYHLSSVDAILKNTNKHTESLFLILFHNTLEIFSHYKLVSFIDSYSGEIIQNNSRIQEVRIFISRLLDLNGSTRKGKFQYVIDLNIDSPELFLDGISTYELHNAPISQHDDGYLMVTSGNLKVDDVNTIIQEFNEAVLNIVTTFPCSRLDEDSIVQTLMHTVKRMIDVDLMEQVISTSWLIVSNPNKIDNYDELLKIRDYLKQHKMKFVPNLEHSCFLINDDLEQTKLEKIFDTVYPIREYSHVEPQFRCEIINRIMQHSSDRFILCPVREYRQLLKFNLQFGDSGFNSGKYVVLLNYDLAHKLSE